MDRDKGARRAEWLVVVATLAAVVSLAVASVWIFSPSSGSEASRSVWHVILADRATLGFVRLLLAALALYGLASVAVLVTRGRWMRSISTSGIEVESYAEGSRVISDLEDDLQRTRAERDEANRLLERFLYG